MENYAHRIKLVNAVFNLDAEEFQRLVDNESFDESLLVDIKFTEGVPCPIQWITQCWDDVIGNLNDWELEVQEIIAEQKANNEKIKRIFTDRFGVKFEPIDFYNTDFWFYRSERDYDFDDIMSGTKEEMVAKGYREIDLDLYVAVSKIDFAEVERLLDAGANPNVLINEEGRTCVDLVSIECSCLLQNLDDVLIIKRYSRPLTCNCTDLIDLLGLGAYERMYTLLTRK